MKGYQKSIPVLFYFPRHDEILYWHCIMNNECWNIKTFFFPSAEHFLVNTPFVVYWRNLLVIRHYLGGICSVVCYVRGITAHSPRNKEQVAYKVKRYLFAQRKEGESTSMSLGDLNLHRKLAEHRNHSATRFTPEFISFVISKVMHNAFFPQFVWKAMKVT